VQARINSYLRAVAPLGREVHRVGPFLATCSPRTDNPYLNYAIPDDAAAPIADDIGALVDWYRSRHRKPRLEYVAGVAPAVEPALVAAEFTVEGRLPLMTWEPTASLSPPDPPGIELLLPASDDDLFAMALVQAEAYASALPSRDEIPQRRAALERGAVAVIARDIASGAVVAAGSCSPIVDGLSEVAAIGVAVTHRRRGIARALARRLAGEALQHGAQVPFLMAADDVEQHIYEQVGFTAVAEILHISR
jgi:ribosomal protein S18 acetylase RimI-like enzyme